MNLLEIKNSLKEKGLKVTPQRLAIYEAVLELKNHPAADDIIGYIRQNHPGISTATVYKVLEALVESGLVKKVKTDRDIMRYDAMTGNHHHLYCAHSDRIEDYLDDELSKMLQEYFSKKEIPGFKIEEIKLQIIGNFKDQ